MKRCPFCAEEIQDAAIVCKHCGRDLGGASPGTVAVAPPPKSKSTWPAVIGVLFAGLVVVGIIGRLSSGGDATGSQHLKAEVSASGTKVTVRNIDRQDWRNVRVMINDHFFCPAMDLIEESKSADVALVTCTSSNGERYNPFNNAASKVTVQAILANDTGEAISAFSLNR